MDNAAFSSMLANAPEELQRRAVTKTGTNKASASMKPRSFKPGKKRSSQHKKGGGSEYRDRAAERRDGVETGEYNQDEVELAKKLDVETSKHLGGTEEDTHLVKGLDFALLRKMKERARGDGGLSGAQTHAGSTTATMRTAVTDQSSSSSSSSVAAAAVTAALSSSIAAGALSSMGRKMADFLNTLLSRSGGREGAHGGGDSSSCGIPRLDPAVALKQTSYTLGGPALHAAVHVRKAGSAFGVQQGAGSASQAVIDASRRGIIFHSLPSSLLDRLTSSLDPSAPVPVLAAEAKGSSARPTEGMCVPVPAQATAAMTNGDELIDDLYGDEDIGDYVCQVEDGPQETVPPVHGAVGVRANVFGGKLVKAAGDQGSATEDSADLLAPVRAALERANRRDDAASSESALEARSQLGVVGSRRETMRHGISMLGALVAEGGVDEEFMNSAGGMGGRWDSDSDDGNSSPRGATVGLGCSGVGGDDNDYDDDDNDDVGPKHRKKRRRQNKGPRT